MALQSHADSRGAWVFGPPGKHILAEDPGPSFPHEGFGCRVKRATQPPKLPVDGPLNKVETSVNSDRRSAPRSLAPSLIIDPCYGRCVHQIVRIIEKGSASTDSNDLMLRPWQPDGEDTVTLDLAEEHPTSGP